MALSFPNKIYIGDLIIYLCGRTLSLEQLSRLPHAPSVGLHDVPSESVGTHIGLKDYDELDERLARECSGSAFLLISRRVMSQSFLMLTPLLVEAPIKFNRSQLFF